MRTKIVISKTYGRFSFSEKAMKLYNKRAGTSFTSPYDLVYLPPHDPHLVAVVEQLGEVEGVHGPYMIEDYDGYESVEHLSTERVMPVNPLFAIEPDGPREDYEALVRRRDPYVLRTLFRAMGPLHDLVLEHLRAQASEQSEDVVSVERIQLVEDSDVPSVQGEGTLIVYCDEGEAQHMATFEFGFPLYELWGERPKEGWYNYFLLTK